MHSPLGIGDCSAVELWGRVGLGLHDQFVCRRVFPLLHRDLMIVSFLGETEYVLLYSKDPPISIFNTYKLMGGMYISTPGPGTASVCVVYI